MNLKTKKTSSSSTHAIFFIQQVHSGISHLWLLIDLWNQENVIGCLLNCDQSERIIWIYSFVKEYYHKDCSPQFINFNKIICFVYFSYCFAYIVGLNEICVYKFMSGPMGPLYLSSDLPPRKWPLLRQWHLKRLKLCMSTRLASKIDYCIGYKVSKWT